MIDDYKPTENVDWIFSAARVEGVSPKVFIAIARWVMARVYSHSHARRVVNLIGEELNVAQVLSEENSR